MALLIHCHHIIIIQSSSSPHSCSTISFIIITMTTKMLPLVGLLIISTISLSSSLLPTSTHHTNPTPVAMSSAFANYPFMVSRRSLQRQLRPSNTNNGAYPVLLCKRRAQISFLQMSTLSQEPSLSQALFALPPDNFSRYSKFLVRTSNVVDGMGNKNSRNDKEEEEMLLPLPWVDNLSVQVVAAEMKKEQSSSCLDLFKGQKGSTTTTTTSSTSSSCSLDR